MRTHTLKLPSGEEVTVRRPGAVASARLLKRAHELESKYKGKLDRDSISDDAVIDVIALQSEKIAACLVSPRLESASEVDDHFDAEDFVALFDAIQEFEGEVAKKTAPFSKAATGS